MGLFDDVSDVVGDVVNVVEGGAGTAESAVDFVGSVINGDIAGATRDAYEFVDNAKDVLEGVRDLGGSIGRVPSSFVDNPVLKLANSPPIELAQRVIAGMRLTTGSGDPVDGEEFKNAATLMQEALEILIDAAPHEDHWNGDASAAYATANRTNRIATSGVQVADWNIAGILEAEAQQVVQTRKTLDDIDEYLFDFALSTAWMNAIPGGRAAKFIVDSGAASLGLGSARRALTSLIADSVERGGRIRGQIHRYDEAVNQDSKLDDPRCDGPFVTAEEDRSNAGRPDRFNNPNYTVPEPIEPPQHGPPATPYGAANPPPASSTPTPHIPASAAPTPPARSSTPSLSSVPNPTAATPSSPQRPPGAAASGALPGTKSGNGGNAPLASSKSRPRDETTVETAK